MKSQTTSENPATMEHAPDYRCALTVLPPEDLWGPIQGIRRHHDRSFVRWMPHINLVFGFVPDTHFDQATALLTQALATIPPFPVELGTFKSFQHRKHCTVWLHPQTDPPDALHELQARVQALFPRCDDQSRKSEHGFTPHLTVGQCPLAQVDEVVSTWQHNWTPIRFTVDAVSLISRRGQEPFVLRNTAPLGGSRSQ